MLSVTPSISFPRRGKVPEGRKGDVSSDSDVGREIARGALSAQIQYHDPDGIHDRRRISDYVVGPEAQHVEAKRLEVLCSLSVVRCLIDVLVTVDFNDQTFTQAGEVGDVAIDWHLAAESKLTGAATAQRLPKRRFCLRRPVAKATCRDAREIVGGRSHFILPPEGEGGAQRRKGDVATDSLSFDSPSPFGHPPSAPSGHLPPPGEGRRAMALLQPTAN